MQIWIDATNPHSALKIFGMTLLERQLHAIVEAGLKPTEVCVALPAGASGAPPLPEKLVRSLPLRWVPEHGAPAERLAQVVGNSNGEPLLAFEADAVIDARLLQYMGKRTGSFAALGGEGAERAAVVRFEGGIPVTPSADARLPELADAGLAQGILRELPLGQVPAYIKKLRRELPVYLFRITDAASRDRAERFLFWSNYKGSTDFFTKYVYPPLVWRMVRPLARWRVHPNVISLFNVFITVAAVFLFAYEYWVTGLSCAYSMSVLDSVDGKLARLTYRSSWFGNILDHGLDLIHPPFWYFGWAWALGQGDVTTPVFQAAIWMAAFYTLDRIVTGLFKLRAGRSIHGYAPIDVRMRTFISRRNINLPLFTVGLLAGVPIPVFYVIVLWQVVTLGFHTMRLAQCWNGRDAAEAAG
ncbi:MAG: CDP-alcohol phosphatidyltransferase family protein [Candidatus Binatia bacterium]